MKNIDGTKNKSQLGANAILAVSLAVARCASVCLNIPLFRYLGGIYPKTIPSLFINVINGGAHADNTVSVQEFMIVPHAPFPESLRIGAEIFYRLRKCLMEQNYNTNVGDEGGFAPSFSSTAEALDILVHAIERAGYIPGKDVSLALDVAASEFFENNVYTYENRQLTSEDMIKTYEKLIEDYPIISIEDPLDEEDWEGFASLTKRIGKKIKIVGDDLFVTQSKRLLKGIDTQTANSILIKPNQVGTLTETLETIQLAQKNGYDVIVSHRSGETEDTFIADLAVAVQAHGIKTGSLSRTDRLAKYNQLSRIYEML
jgi:enolase